MIKGDACPLLYYSPTAKDMLKISLQNPQKKRKIFSKKPRRDGSRKHNA
jgi:hypothetical protein